MNDGPSPGDFEPRPHLRGMSSSDGTNPFRDDAEALPANDHSQPIDHLYAGPGGPFAASPNPNEFEMVLPHRGTIVFLFGLFGLLGVTVGSVGLLCCLPFPMFALALTVPAWLMGRMDIKAIDAGAMDKSGRRSTYIGYVMGIAGTIIAILICLGFGGWMIWELLRSA